MRTTLTLIAVAIVVCSCSAKVKIFEDPQNDNKKCEYNRLTRVFDLRGKDANEQNCRNACTDKEKCIAFSGIWNSWCIGCAVGLKDNHSGAIAFKKTDLTDKFTTKLDEVLNGFNDLKKEWSQFKMDVLKLTDSNSNAIHEMENEQTLFFEKILGYHSQNNKYCSPQKLASYSSIDEAKNACNYRQSCRLFYQSGNQFFICPSANAEVLDTASGSKVYIKN